MLTLNLTLQYAKFRLLPAPENFGSLAGRNSSKAICSVVVCKWNHVNEDELSWFKIVGSENFCWVVY